MASGGLCLMLRDDASPYLLNHKRWDGAGVAKRSVAT